MSEQITASEGTATPSFSPGESVSQPTAPPDGPAKSNGNGAVSPPAAANPGEQRPEPRGVGKRIQELTSERNYWRDFAMQFARQPQQQPKAEQQEAESDEEITLASVGYDEKKLYQKLAERASKQATKTASEVARKERERMEFEARLSSHDERVAKFLETVEDFDVESARRSMSFVHQDMADAIIDSDESAAIEYYLSKNLEEARKISQMPPGRMGRAIERIEARLIAERKKAAEKPVSQAPPPPPKIEGSDPGNVETDPAKMTDAQFRKWREKQIAARGR